MSSKTLPKIIGISGTNGSGKDTIGKILEQDHDYLFVSVTDILRAELARQGLPLAREQMRNLSAQWRRQYGLPMLVNKALEIYQEKIDQFSGIAMASLRNPGEADEVHKRGGVVIWLDADPKLRYRRVQANIQNRGQARAIDDRKTFEQFIADEEVEMRPSSGADNAFLSLSGVKEKSDIVLINEGDDLDELKAKLNQALGF